MLGIGCLELKSLVVIGILLGFKQNFYVSFSFNELHYYLDHAETFEDNDERFVGFNILL